MFPPRWIPFEEITIDVFLFVPLPSISLTPLPFKTFPSSPSSYRLPSSYPSLNSSCFRWPFRPTPILLCLIPLPPPSTLTPLFLRPLLPSCLIKFDLYCFSKNVLNELNRAKPYPLRACDSLLDPVDVNFCYFSRNCFVHDGWKVYAIKIPWTQTYSTV